MPAGGKPTPAGHPGVRPKGSRWQATMQAYGRREYIGTFDTIEEAVRAREKALAWVASDPRNLSPRMRNAKLSA